MGFNPPRAPYTPPGPVDMVPGGKPDPVVTVGAGAGWATAIAVVPFILVAAGLAAGLWCIIERPWEPERTWVVAFDGEEVFRIKNRHGPRIVSGAWGGPLAVYSDRGGFVVCNVPDNKVCRIYRITEEDK